MEIERKFLIKSLPKNLESYPHHHITQAYLCTEPVIRIRQKDEVYILTYKSKGLLAREEVEMPLTKDSFEHLLKKADGMIIEKERYCIPLNSELTIELDVFEQDLKGLILAEIEFKDEETALAYEMEDWFIKDVTMDSAYHNSTMSKGNIPPFQ